LLSACQFIVHCSSPGRPWPRWIAP
jgi:hypothetical protein